MDRLARASPPSRGCTPRITRFDEIVLLDSKADSIRRFAERSATSRDPAHVEAQQMLDLAGGRDELGRMYERLEAVLRARPRARIVRTEDGKVARAYRDFLGQPG